MNGLASYRLVGHHRYLEWWAILGHQRCSRVDALGVVKAADEKSIVTCGFAYWALMIEEVELNNTAFSRDAGGGGYLALEIGEAAMGGDPIVAAHLVATSVLMHGYKTELAALP